MKWKISTGVRNRMNKNSQNYVNHHSFFEAKFYDGDSDELLLSDTLKSLSTLKYPIYEVVVKKGKNHRPDF